MAPTISKKRLQRRCMKADDAPVPGFCIRCLATMMIPDHCTGEVAVGIAGLQPVEPALKNP